ncbi:hypothetical protein ACE38W_16330 [Chitinophaga sp. Hz27]|uniref:DUF7638 domain-containing protein n=1 Tax=Chitinophaga sp. Hz27 TaxID=3347169 RepID=UPI0035DCB10C
MSNPTRIYRKQLIEGFSIPAIIHNASYYFTDLDVYADGRVQCWNFEDLEHFKNDVKRGWVSLSIPEGDQISIYGLGCWTISNGNWCYTQETFIDYVLSLIKELNPNLENIYQYKPRVVNGVTIGESGQGTIYKTKSNIPPDPFEERISGDSMNVFYRANDSWYLAKTIVFPDNTITLTRLETPVDISFQEFEALIDKGIIQSEIPSGTKVMIHGLGSFIIGEAHYTTEIAEILLEIQDAARKLRNEPTTLDICINAYQQYLDNPTAANKALLKTSYENVPDHQKMYVGDMDTKDIAVRMIIYGDEEIENWSHYQVATSMGESLPSIVVPKTKDNIEDGE